MWAWPLGTDVLCESLAFSKILRRDAIFRRILPEIPIAARPQRCPAMSTYSLRRPFVTHRPQLLRRLVRLAPTVFLRIAFRRAFPSPYFVPPNIYPFTTRVTSTFPRSVNHADEAKRHRYHHHESGPSAIEALPRAALGCGFHYYNYYYRCY
jgi:hypothetical protein